MTTYCIQDQRTSFESRKPVDPKQVADSRGDWSESAHLWVQEGTEDKTSGPANHPNGLHPATQEAVQHHKVWAIESDLIIFSTLTKGNEERILMQHKKQSKQAN